MRQAAKFERDEERESVFGANGREKGACYYWCGPPIYLIYAKQPPKLTKYDLSP